MSDPPRRFKTLEELSVEEHLQRKQGARPPESDDYREARRKALENAGLEPDPNERNRDAD